MACYGSTEYVLTWKTKSTKSKRLIFVLRASPLHKRDRGSSGWPSPAKRDSKGPFSTGVGTDLSKTAATYGWATPTVRDHKDGSSVGTVDANGLLGRQVWGYAETTENCGALNPAFSLWLMGYPTAWLSSGVRAMQSFQSSRPSSSKRAKKPETSSSSVLADLI